MRRIPMVVAPQLPLQGPPQLGHFKRHRISLLILITVFAFTFSGAVNAQSLTSGNLVIQRVGDGASALTNGSTATFLDQFTVTGTAVNTINMPNATLRPTNSPFNLTNSGTASSEGLLSRSANGLFVNLAGYNGINGDTSIASSNTATILRTIGVVSGNGTVDTTRGFTASSGNNARAAVSVDGSSFYLVGGAGINSMESTTSGNGTSLTTRTTRQGNIFNNTFFVTAGSTSAPYTAGEGVYQVGAAGTLPTTANPTFTRIINTGTGSSVYGFQFNTAMTVAYVADDRANSSGGIQKWTSNGAGIWSLAYTLGTGVTNIGARGLTVDWSDPLAPVIYGTSAESSSNRLFSISDTGASSAATTLATAANNRVFRGVEIALLPSVWTSSTSGDWSSTASTTYNTTIGSVATPFNNWSTNLVNGTNLAFQKVNSASLALNNNSSLISVAAIGFSGQGFGSSDTAYTLTGNALVLNGTNAVGSGVTGSGITNNSTVTQTVNIPLTLGADQTFAANNGGLSIGGTTLSLGSGANGYTLTVAGAQNTTVSSVIQNGGTAAGAVSKSGGGALTLSGANTYTGGTTISGGTLALGATGSINTTPTITVNSGATFNVSAVSGGYTVGSLSTDPQTLQGVGNATGDVFIGASGTIRGDTGTGTDSIKTGNVTNNTGGQLDVQLGTGLTASRLDLSAAGGVLTLNNGAIIDPNGTLAGGSRIIANLGTGTNRLFVNGTAVDVDTEIAVYEYASGTGVQDFGTSGLKIDVTSLGLTAGDKFILNRSGNDLVLNFSPVPEPTTILGVAVGLVAVGGFIRKRLAKKATVAA